MQDSSLPERFAGESVEAEQNPLLGLSDACNKEDSVIPDDGRCVAAAGQSDIPTQIISGWDIPMDRYLALEARAVAARAAPAGPVFGAGGCGQDQTAQPPCGS